MILSGLIRLVFFILLVYLFTKLFKKLFLKVGRPRQSFNDKFAGRKSPAVNEMVQDPVCSVYIPRTEAQTLIHNGTTYFFCSAACKKRFQRDMASDA